MDPIIKPYSSPSKEAIIDPIRALQGVIIVALLQRDRILEAKSSVELDAAWAVARSIVPLHTFLGSKLAS